MTFELKFNGETIQKSFPTVEWVKSYLSEANPGTTFTVEGSEVNVDELFEMLKHEDGPVSVYTLAMCELGDDYVEIELIVKADS